MAKQFHIFQKKTVRHNNHSQLINNYSRVRNQHQEVSFQALSAYYTLRFCFSNPKIHIKKLPQIQVVNKMAIFAGLN